MTIASVEVEDVIDRANDLRGVIVAQIKEVLPHPDADKLQLARVFDGKQELMIVCGAPNIAAGQKVPLATIGTYLPVINLTIEERPVRGQVSQGMLCAPDELGLGDDHAGILVLPDDVKVGEPLADALGLHDWMIDVDNKSMTHRPDMWGHYGIAREVAAFLDQKLKPYKVTPFTVEGKEKLKAKVQDAHACPRYSVVMIDGVVVTQSPQWMQQRLRAVGQEPINNIVDATNYVMYELGQPMHAFDATQIASHSLMVRMAQNGEQVTTLDGKEYKLTAQDAVIADADKPLAIAGIKGLANSGVSEQTTSLILEAANFDHVTIRKTSQRLNLRTDSSARFEKSLDPMMTITALYRCVELLRETCPDITVVSEIVDVQADKKAKPQVVTLEVAYAQRIIGNPISAATMKKILIKLGFDVAGTKETLKVTIPSWRATKDIEHAYDLIEEIARIYGYDAIEPHLPQITIVRPRHDFKKALIEKTRDILAYGFDGNEVQGYSFLGERDVQLFGENPEHFIRVLNPQAKGLDVLRRELLPGLIMSVSANAHNYDSFSLFEIGKVFRKEEQGAPIAHGATDYLPGQDAHVAGVIYEKGNASPYYTAKNIVEVLLHQLHFIPEFIELPRQTPWLHEQRLRYVSVDGDIIGIVSELESSTQKKLKIRERVGIYELNMEKLAAKYSERRTYLPIPKYPSIEMDISMIVDARTQWQQIVAVVRSLSKEWIRDVMIFDVYEGENIEQGKKSVAFRITYRSDDRTLETKEVDALHNDVKARLRAELGAEVREG